MEKYYEVGKEYLSHHAAPSFAAAAALLILSPLVVGIRNLDTAQSARVLETFVALIGILLFVPIFLPEQDKALRDTVSARYTRMETIYSVRAALALAGTMLYLLLYMLAMQSGDCRMEFGRFYLGTLCEMAAFGGLGVLSYALCDNLVAGYMIPLFYVIAAMGGGEKYLGKFYPFQMIGDYSSKYWLGAAGVLCLAEGILLRGRKR